MKGARSNRVATTDPPDDWVNGSWTVDCICGVTFDDGEEMVNCDECGVWVHTRCSRFLKGDKSFACDKCKSKRSRTSFVTDDEETEVAQLLVDLPIHHNHKHKHHLKMTSSNNNNSNSNSGSAQCLRPYPLWTQRPLEDRVHVQGVPGGDASLFDSNPFPLVISPHLWKCSGYIPKHFNFHYTEFPCWQTPLHPVLDTPPSLPLTDSDLPPPAAAPPKKPNQNTLLHFSSKRSREDAKDSSAKKKIKAFHRDHPPQQNPDKLPSPKTAVDSSTTTTLMPAVESTQQKSVSNAHLASGSNLEKAKRNAAAAAAATDDANFTPRSPQDSSPSTSIDKSNRTTLKSFPSPDKDAIFETLVKKEGHVLAVNEIQTSNSASPTFTSDMPKSKPLTEDLTNAASKHKSIEKETKSDACFDNPKGALASHPALNVKLDFFENVTDYVSSPNQECKGSKLSEGVANTCKPLEHDEKDGDNGLEAEAGCQFDRNHVIKSEGSDSPTIVHKFLRDSEEVARVEGQAPQPSETVPTPPPSHHKMASTGKSSSTPPAIVFSRSCLSDKSRSGDSQNPSLVGKRLMSNSSVNTKKEYASVNLVKNEDKHDKPISTLKDNSKPCLNPTLKASQPSRTVLKCYTSVGKESLRHSSSKVSPVDCSSVSSSVNEPAGALQSEHGLHGQNKNVASGCQQRGEKVSQSNLQSSSKSNQTSVGHPTGSSNSPAGLSDEELALLLHQELNSSPRVPRVPRVRHAGNLPQLSSATAANMLMKRTNSGGKDRNTFSRRRSRDASKDESRNSREQDTEASKVDRVPSSPDSLRKSGAFTQAEYSTDSKAKKNREKILSQAANSGPFSADAAVLKSSPAQINSPEDDVGANRNSDLTYRTLPGLIAEIMGTGRRMTYEELCNAVLPHWPNLRKHNGERYAYSSHSQAVLDCLRNRAEWARLVDRGPKTSSSRKKRKIDAEPLSCESEEDEDRNLKDGESKSFESNREEYPKGRRKARKRRGPSQQGRSAKEGQKRRKVEVGSSCDSGSFSNSSEDTVSCEDDSQGSEMDASNTEVSASSHEDRAAMS